MTGTLILVGGMLHFAGTIAFLDWLGRREDRRVHKQP